EIVSEKIFKIITESVSLWKWGVSNDEIKKSVFGNVVPTIAPGPDGFTFGFFRHFWHLVDRDVCEAGQFGFGEIWRKWIQLLSFILQGGGLSLSTGGPTVEFIFVRGLKQGIKKSLCAKANIIGIEVDTWMTCGVEGGKLKYDSLERYALENSKQITWVNKLAHPSLYLRFYPDSWSWTLYNSGSYSVAVVEKNDRLAITSEGVSIRIGGFVMFQFLKLNTFAWKVDELRS
ncbi:hypothetical protein Tco_1153907, partial [Tanacetum coccineum]